MTDSFYLPGQALRHEHRYEVLDEIERTSLVSLHRARSANLHAPVVLASYHRLLRVGLVQSAVRSISTTLRESFPALQGPGVPPIVDVVLDKSSLPTLVYRLPPGELLLQKLDRGETLSVARVVRLIEDVAAALATYRDAGPEPHRGPTPDRVWLTDDGKAYLLGFGEVPFRASIDPRSGVGDSKADLRWHLPPEAYADQLDRSESHGARDVERDPRAEVYTLGCTAYAALAGFHPFFTDRTALQLGITAMMSETPQELRSLAARSKVAETIMGAISRSVELRWADPSAFAMRLKQAADEDAGAERGDRAADKASVAHDGRMRGQRGERPAALPWWQREQLWQATAGLLFLCFLALFLHTKLQRVSLVITTDPPAIPLAEALGHTTRPLGTTPLVLTNRNPLTPIRLHVQAPDGSLGPLHTYDPSTGNHFRDLGTCRWLPLRLTFDDMPP